VQLGLSANGPTLIPQLRLLDGAGGGPDETSEKSPPDIGRYVQRVRDVGRCDVSFESATPIPIPFYPFTTSPTTSGSPDSSSSTDSFLEDDDSSSRSFTLAYKVPATVSSTKTKSIPSPPALSLDLDPMFNICNAKSHFDSPCSPISPGSELSPIFSSVLGLTVPGMEYCHAYSFESTLYAVGLDESMCRFEADEMRARIVRLLDFADELNEQLESVVVVLRKESKNLARFLHALMYVGGVVLTQQGPTRHSKATRFGNIPLVNYVLVGLEL